MDNAKPETIVLISLGYDTKLVMDIEGATNLLQAIAQSLGGFVGSLNSKDLNLQELDANFSIRVMSLQKYRELQVEGAIS